MIDAIGGKVVMVSNQAAALDFYVNKLGLQKKVDMNFGSMRWLEVAPVNSETTISLMEPSPKIMPPEVAEAAKRSIGTPTGLWFYTNDIRGTFAELKAKGVNISQPQKQDWGGIMSIIKDLDGNEYQLISAPEPTK
ncbi:MAG TPA: VOC family protein [Nitrosopumilaceae archaeon]